MSDEFNLGDLLAFLGEEVRATGRTLASGLSDLSKSPEVTVLRHVVRSAARAGASQREVAAALDELRKLADRLRREGVDPALGLANLLGDTLEGLDVLVATEAVPVPVELRELRLALARLRRPETRLDLTLPVEGARPALAGRLVRALVEDATPLMPSPAELHEIEEAATEAVAGAVRRTRAFDPGRPVEVRVRLRGDLLALDVTDACGRPEPAGATGSRLAEPEWDLPLLRRVMDEVRYEPGERGGTLHLAKRLPWWR